MSIRSLVLSAAVLGALSTLSTLTTLQAEDAAKPDPVEARKLQAAHDKAVRAAESDVTAKTREVDRIDKAISDNETRSDKLDKDLDKAKADVIEVGGAKDRVAKAKAALDAADARVQKEFDANRNQNTKTGGASSDALKAQEDAQKDLNRAKQLAQNADADLAVVKSRQVKLERERKAQDKKKDDLLKSRDDAAKQLDDAKAKLAAITAEGSAPVKSDAPAKPEEPGKIPEKPTDKPTDKPGKQDDPKPAPAEPAKGGGGDPVP